MQFNYIWSERDIDAPAVSGDMHTAAMRFSLDF
jgi:hypothetical protein